MLEMPLQTMEFIIKAIDFNEIVIWLKKNKVSFLVDFFF